MRAVIFLVFAWSFIFANTVIHFDKGWKLVGVPTTLNDMRGFNNSNVEVVWAFNATEQKWEGYSPEPSISQKISDNNISVLNSLQPWQAVWVLSKEAWGLKIQDSNSHLEPKNNSIVLKQGWNLVTIPNKAIVWKNFFGDAVVWKYSEAWSVNDDSLNFPTITNIKESEGFWVKSEKDLLIDMGEQLSKLSTFDSEANMLSYLREMQTSNFYRYNYSNATVNDSNNTTPDSTDGTTTQDGQKDVDATTTNLQETGVDESDILKNDGKYIYSIDNVSKQIFITSFENIAQKNYKAINTISTSQQGSIVAMYLQNNRLILISDTINFYYSDEESARLTDEELSYTNTYKNKDNHTVEITIYNVSDVNNILKLSSQTIDGTYEDSRLIDGKLFFITKFNPEIEYDYPKVYVDSICSTLNLQEVYTACSYSIVPVGTGAYNQTEDCNNGDDYNKYQDNQCYIYHYDKDGRTWKYDYEHPTIKREKLVPNIVSNGVTNVLLKPSNLYAPQKLDQAASITTISSFDINSAQYKESISFLGNTHTYYASTSSLYLVSSEYPLYYGFNDFTQRQMIYKFALGDTLSYKGKGFVDGKMLNQFSMSEKDDYLRVATTEANSWGGIGTKNSVFTLQENNKILEVKGSLIGLGKENETIKAVRFMGDRGFVVTFKQTDPLYTLDMSNPLNPKAVGELSIPGFSRYLHVVDENRLLSIGRDANVSTGRALGLQLQLFDITNFASPQLVSKVNIGDSNTYSSAEYNHKAFVYRPSDLMFGLPHTDYIYESNANDYQTKTSSTENFTIYQLDGMKIKELHTISKAFSKNYWGDDKRGLIFDLNNTTYGTLFQGSDLVSDTILKGK